MDRRHFLKQTGSLALGALFLSHISCSTGKKAPSILIVSGWQDVNIGDIAHTPGLLHILENTFPESKITLWKRSKNDDVEALLKRNFPRIEILHGNVEEQVIQSEEVLQAVAQADIFIHGSGPNVLAEYLEGWISATNKPFGIFGVTIQDIPERLKMVLQKASFIFTRETASIEVLKKQGLTGDHILFAPDATFDLNIWDDGKALAFMEENGLEENKFICVIPRLRRTPYWHMLTTTGHTQKDKEYLDAFNDKWKEIDHAKARQAIVAWVRETGNKVVLCPEMTYQVDIIDELLFDPLPEEVKPFVVKHGYWLPDEAMSLYSRMHTLLSFECHSPIMALRCRRPTFYLRQPEDTIKGQMYYDLGLSDWVFEIEESIADEITARLMEVVKDYDKAREKAAGAIEIVAECYHKAIKIVGKTAKQD